MRVEIREPFYSGEGAGGGTGIQDELLPTEDEDTIEFLIKKKPYVAQIKLRDHWSDVRLRSRQVLVETFFADNLGEVERLESDAMHYARSRRELMFVSSPRAKLHGVILKDNALNGHTRDVEELVKSVNGERGEEFVQVAGSFVRATYRMHLFTTDNGPHYTPQQLEHLISETGGIPDELVTQRPEVSSS